ncbi:unnamed protein product [Closterium sp. NIES-53]
MDSGRDKLPLPSQRSQRRINTNSDSDSQKSEFHETTKASTFTTNTATTTISITTGNVAPQIPPLVVPSGPVSPISPLPVPPPSIIIPPRELAQSAAYAGGGRGAFAQKRGGVEQPSGLPPSLPPSLVHWPYATHMPAVSPGFTHLPKSHSDGNGAPPTASPATQGRMRHENWGEIGSPWQGGGGRGISPGMTPGVAESPASGGSAGWPAGSHGKVTRVPSGENRPIPVSTVPWQQPKMSPLRRTRSSPCGEDAPGGGGTIWEQWQALGGWGRKAEGNQGSAGSGGGGDAVWAPPPLPAAAVGAALAGAAAGSAAAAGAGGAAASGVGGAGKGKSGKKKGKHSESIASRPGSLRVEAAIKQSTWTVSLLTAPCHVSSCLCMEACFCPCVTAGRIAHALDPASTTPAAGALLYSLLSCFLSCHVFSAVLRGRVRQRYSLPEAPLGGVEDCCTHCCCNACALMQEMQEMQVRGRRGD